MLEQLKPLLKKKKYNLLDLGCGTGLSGQCFADIAKKITGIDISGNMLIKAKEKACYDALIEKDILRSLVELKELYDLILCIDTLVYFGDLNEFFTNIIYCLTKNGLLAFSVELGEKAFLHIFYKPMADINMRKFI